MSARKPLEEGCTGGIFCPVERHVGVRILGGNRRRISHIPLTSGQNKTLRERRAAQRKAIQ